VSLLRDSAVGERLTADLTAKFVKALLARFDSTSGRRVNNSLVRFPARYSTEHTSTAQFDLSALFDQGREHRRHLRLRRAEPR